MQPLLATTGHSIAQFRSIRVPLVITSQDAVASRESLSRVILPFPMVITAHAPAQRLFFPLILQPADAVYMWQVFAPDIVPSMSFRITVFPVLDIKAIAEEPINMSRSYSILSYV
ncbi:hypothetical protein ES703_119189 [subsurface metagenome]